MKTERVCGLCGMVGYSLLAFVLLGALGGAAWGDIIASARRVTWEGNVGVSGDIPNRTAVYTTLNPGGNIQTAINNCPVGQVVKLNAGIFNVSSPIRVKSGVTLRGSGKGATIIRATAGMNYVIGFDVNTPDYTFSRSTVRSIIGGNTKGSRTITTSAAHGWSVGDIILIDQLHQPSGDPVVDEAIGEGCTYCGRANGTRPWGQLVKLVAPTSGSTATLEIPLYWSYKQTPQGVKLTGITKNAGIEDLTVDATNVRIDENYGTVMCWFADNCWLLRVEVYGVEKNGIRMYGTYRNTIRTCEIHKSTAYTSNKGYGIWLNPMESANLIEDNIFHDLTVGLTYNGCTSGNVIAYNYFRNMKSTDFPTAVRPAVPAHGAHPIMNLFEGNYFDGPIISADLYHGTSSHNTFFRNRVIADKTKTSSLTTVFLWKGQTYYNFVGNILGVTGFETLYEMSPCTDGSSTKIIYCLDYAGSWPPSDGKTAATLYLHGNWDSVNAKTIWDSNNSDRNLPASLYLSSKPSWWGSLPWPSIGPDLVPKDRSIPAKTRFYGIVPPSGVRIVDP